MKKFWDRFFYVVMIVVVLLAITALASCDTLIPQGVMGAGVTNLTNLELAGTLDVGGNTDLVGTLNYGANNLYLIGHSASGEQFFFGVQNITTSETVTHGLTTVTYALCTMAEDPTSGVGDAVFCTVAVSGNAVTLKTWQDDYVTGATEIDVAVMYLIIGTP